MIYVMYIVTGVCLFVAIFLAKYSADKSKDAADSSRQMNELRATYQKMEYTISTLEKKNAESLVQIKTLQDELADVISKSPMADSNRINNRLKK